VYAPGTKPLQIVHRIEDGFGATLNWLEEEMNGKITVLLVEKDPQITQLLLLLMTEPAWPPLPFTLVCVDGLDAARQALGADDSIQVVLLDAALSGSSLIEALRVLRTHFPATPVVVLTEPGGEAVGLEAVRSGAQDYQVKGSLDARTLKRTLSCAVVRQRLTPRREVRRRHVHA
jgi:DNA-binding response OmpR family regulator